MEHAPCVLQHIELNTSLKLVLPAVPAARCGALIQRDLLLISRFHQSASVLDQSARIGDVFGIIVVLHCCIGDNRFVPFVNSLHELIHMEPCGCRDVKNARVATSPPQLRHQLRQELSDFGDVTLVYHNHLWLDCKLRAEGCQLRLYHLKVSNWVLGVARYDMDQCLAALHMAKELMTHTTPFRGSIQEARNITQCHPSMDVMLVVAKIGSHSGEGIGRHFRHGVSGHS
mmetsp:Transcript_38696/g.90956  ORF Transcript_38696/g.90956 Transcript_38696/m.90956 type:complete len:229 (-) Transcript_38696:1066-1752(-)